MGFGDVDRAEIQIGHAGELEDDLMGLGRKPFDRARSLVGTVGSVKPLAVCIIAPGAFRDSFAEQVAKGRGEKEFAATQTPSGSSSETDLRRAIIVLEMAESEYRSAMEKSKTSPGALSELELDRLRAKHCIADLDVARARLAGSGDEAALQEIEIRHATIVRGLAETEFLSARESNKAFACSELSLLLSTVADLSVRRVVAVIVENKVNRLTLPPLCRGIGLGGLGASVTLLRNVPWLSRCRSPTGEPSTSRDSKSSPHFGRSSLTPRDS